VQIKTLATAIARVIERGNRMSKTQFYYLQVFK